MRCQKNRLLALYVPREGVDMLRRVCVFAGSRSGAQSDYVVGAKALGKELVKRDIELVFGGYNDGLMKEVADTMLAEGGRIVGVVPKGVFPENMIYRNDTMLHVAETMHERKRMMADLSDAFVALPGGLGTLEELIEVFSWGEIGLHAKPLGLLDVNDFYKPLLAFIDHAVSEGFVAKEHYPLLCETRAETLLAALIEARPDLRVREIDSE